MRIKWSDKLVIQSILNRHAEGKALNFQDVVNDDEKLTGAARRYFGSWDKAMQAAGFNQSEYKNPETKKEKWNREKVITRLKSHIEKGEDISPHAVQKYDSKLYASGVYYFGSWEKVIDHLGIDYSEIKKTEDWSTEVVIEMIQESYKSGADLSDATVSTLSPKLYGAAYYHFQGWREAIEASGIDPDTIRRTRKWNKDNIIELLIKAVDNGVTIGQLSNLGIISTGDVMNHFSSYEDLYVSAGVKPEEHDRRFQSGSPVGNNIRQFRKAHKLSQSELGERVGYSHRWISLIENHEIGIRMDDAIKLARVFDVTLDELFLMDSPLSK